MLVSNHGKAPSISEGGATTKKLFTNKGKMEFLINYFAKIESPNFNAYEYYALEIDQYFTIKNTNPSFVNQEVRSADNDYQHKKTILVPHSVDFSHHDRDIDYYTFNVDFSCYRPSKIALQECEVFAQVGLNNALRAVQLMLDALQAAYIGATCPA